MIIHSPSGTVSEAKEPDIKLAARVSPAASAVWAGGTLPLSPWSASAPARQRRARSVFSWNTYKSQQCE